MKAIVTNIVVILAWALIGHYLGLISFFFSFIILQVTFAISTYLIKSKLGGAFVIPFCYVAILCNDYLFRIFGAGIHDEPSRGWCELVFYFTLSTSTITLLPIAYHLSKRNNRIWFCNTVIVLFSAIVTYCTFINYLINI